MAKLTRLKVRAIRGLYETGAFSQTELAVMFHVQQMAISRIVRNQYWIDA